MINFDGITKENIKEHNLNRPKTLDHSYGVLTIGGSGSGRTNALLNLISHQPDIEKIYFHAKDPYDTNYQLLINKCEGLGLKYYNGSNAFIEHSNDMDDINKNMVYKNITDYNPNKYRKILIAFDDMIAHMLSNKNLQQIVTKSLTRGRKLDISLACITGSYFAVPKILDITLRTILL